MSTCKHCKAEIDADVKYCPHCGTANSQTLPGDDIGETAEIQKTTLNENTVLHSGKEGLLKTRPKLIKNLFITAGLVVCLALAAFLYINFFAKAKVSVLYIKDEEMYFTFLPSVSPFRITDELLDAKQDVDMVVDLLQFYIQDPVFLTKDGRYLFYFDKITEEGIASLYYRDLKNDKTKSEAIRVDSEISVFRPVVVLDDGSKIFYVKDDDRFYCHDLVDRSKIDNDVSYFIVNKSGDYVVYVNSEGTIYEKYFFLFIIVAILIINSTKHKIGLAASYSDEKDKITVNVTRPSNRHEPYEYESRPGGGKIVSLSNHYTENDIDVFVFDILGNQLAD